MKPVVYSNLCNVPERIAQQKGYKFIIKALNIMEDRWVRLYYKQQDLADKECERMNKLPQVYRNISNPKPI